MSVKSVFMTTTSVDSPLDGSRGETTKKTVSDFVTVQSFANFATITGAVTAGWHALEKVWPAASSISTPYVFAGVWALISVVLSIEGLKTEATKAKKSLYGTILQAVFIAVINALVLAGAVVGTTAVALR